MAINNPYAIRQEIQRFESVHPSIYAIYDLIELIPDIQVSQQIREHIVNIEGRPFRTTFVHCFGFRKRKTRIIMWVDARFNS